MNKSKTQGYTPRYRWACVTEEGTSGRAMPGGRSGHVVPSVANGHALPGGTGIKWNSRTADIVYEELDVRHVEAGQFSPVVLQVDEVFLGGTCYVVHKARDG